MKTPTHWCITIRPVWRPESPLTVRLDHSKAGDGWRCECAGSAVVEVSANLQWAGDGWTEEDAAEYNRRMDADEVDGGVSMSVIEHYADGTTRTLTNGEW